MAISKDTTGGIGTVLNADPPKPKSKRGGRRANQTGRPPSVLRPILDAEQMRRLNALARDEGITATQLVEEKLAAWLDLTETGESADQIERWERFEKAEKENKKGKLPPKKKSTIKKLPASKIKVHR